MIAADQTKFVEVGGISIHSRTHAWVGMDWEQNSKSNDDGFVDR